MNHYDAIHSTLAQLVRLLQAQGAHNWANALARNSATLEQAPRVALEELLRCYGGSGSFNDQVLGGVPVSVNEQLDQLRQRLFEQLLSARQALCGDT